MDSRMSWAGIEEEKAEMSVWCLCGKAVSVDTSLPLLILGAHAQRGLL